MFVLGIDPGISRCGYGAVRSERGVSTAVASGVLTTPPDQPLPQRLASLAVQLRGLLADLQPPAVAVERLFFQVNVRTAMSVGQASGLVLAAAAEAGCEVVQYTPKEVKQAVVGWGGAPKPQVQRMVQVLLSLPERPSPPDAADALALALCHLAVAPLMNRVKAAEVRDRRAPARQPPGSSGAPSARTPTRGPGT